MFNPPGYIPGQHIPGTLTPIGAVVQMQQEAERAAVERAEAARREQARRRRHNLLLLHRS